MNYYKVIVENKLGKEYFFYKSIEDIAINTIVSVPLRNKEYYGLCIEKVSKIDDIIDFDKTLILDIIYIYNIVIPEPIINFIKLTNQTTFLTINELVGQLIDNTSSHLGKNEMKKLIQNPQNNSLKPKIQNQKPLVFLPEFKINYHIDIFIMLRIIYLIRSLINLKFDYKNTHNKTRDLNVAIFFPEIKMLDRYKAEIENKFQEITKESQGLVINIYKFTNLKGKESRQLIKKLLNDNIIGSSNDDAINNNTSYNNCNIIITTKLGLFLPYSNIDQVIVIDEASSFYIQEQNSLYYDLRELVYMLSSSFKANLTFISKLPSLRLHKHTSKAFEFKNDTSSYLNKEKFLKMQICRSNYEDKEKTDLFSFQILEMLCYLDD